ncbi:MAG: metal-dependent hydrolase [Haloarculaceae archaeon]
MASYLGSHALFVAVAVVASRDRKTGGAVAAGYLSHSLVDATTPMGVPLASPVSSESVGVTLGGHSVGGTVVLWGTSLVLFLAAKRRDRLANAGGAESQ